METIVSNPNILGGTPCFAGTRVPAEILFEYLRDGSTIEEFFTQFPTVTREQVEAVLDLAKERTIPFPPAPGSRRAAG